MKPTREYRAALAELVSRIGKALAGAPPVKMYIAGGAALYLATGARVSEDVDAVFSQRVLLPEAISVSYRDADGTARILYLDRNFNDTLGLMHEDAYRDARPLRLEGAQANRIQVCVLSPLDVAVTKLARFSTQDRGDIELLARERLIEAKSLRRRADEALRNYVGDTQPVRTSIDIACRLVEEIRRGERR